MVQNGALAPSAQGSPNAPATGLDALISSPGAALSNTATLLNAINGLQSGSTTGQIQGATGLAALANKAGLFSSNGTSNPLVSSGLGGVSGALGLITGLQKGGVAGYAGAAAGGLQLGSSIESYLGNSAKAAALASGATPEAAAAAGAGNFGTASSLGSAASYIAAPLSIYNAISNFKPGAAAADSMNFASAGAAIGSIVPGLGTLVGGLVGAGVGAVASMFGGSAGSKSEIQPFLDASTQYRQNGNSLSNLQNPYLALAGLFDYTPGQMSSTVGNMPIYDQFGRMGEGPFVESMTQQINSALSAGKISKTSSAADIMSSVVNPWIQSFGKGAQGNIAGQGDITNAIVQQAVQQYIDGSYATDWKASGGDNPFAGNNLITPFGAAPGTASANAIDMTAGGGGGGDLSAVRAFAM